MKSSRGAAAGKWWPASSWLGRSVEVVVVISLAVCLVAANESADVSASPKQQRIVGGDLGGASLKGADSAAAAPERKLAEPVGLQVEAQESNIANAKVSLSPEDISAAAGHQHGKSHGKYFMYAEVPKKGAYKMAFRRGNGKHEIERKESVHKNHVHSYFKWHDKKGKGSHKFEYKHYDKKKHHGHH